MEASYQNNFNVGFSTYKSDILCHLSQWQYWWWFWFSFFWTFYYFLIIRTIKSRVVKMNLRLNTSVRGRGKWGDFVVALIPVSWCLNILINSNFILRMIEWQNESSLFTIRIHGKQWYWIYKFDLKNSMDIFTTPKSAGKNRWFVQTPSELLVTDTYLQAVQLRSKIDWVNEYWSNLFNKDFLSMQTSELFSNSPITSKKNLTEPKKHIAINTFNDDIFDTKILKKKAAANKHYDYIDLEDEWDILNNIKKKTAPGPVRIIKTLLTNFSNKEEDLLKIRFYDFNDSVEPKIRSNADYFVLKQRRYKKKQRIENFSKKGIDPKKSKQSSEAVLIKFYSKRVIKNNKIMQDLHAKKKFDSYTMYKVIRNNRKRSTQIPVTLSRRLLRTKRTLVLPAHTNLTVVTNSYDVVHSWFIPGLGIKMDCVPGRSTHHSFYIDNVGFYYGQCAEICGRYHHHMPIRLCALPFEHFLVWWQTKGMPKLLKLKNITDGKKETFLKYTW